MQQGKLIIFSAPSGAGKTTLARYLLTLRKDLAFSISCTTRAIRGKEKHGVDYYFIGEQGFKEKIKNDEFIEYEQVYKGGYYGTLKSEVYRIWQTGKIVVFDVDVVGGLNLKKQFGSNALAIFVKPPSISVLRDRLKERSTESAEKIALRMAKAKHEISFSTSFDVILINDDLQKAKEKLKKIVDDFI